MIYRKRFDPKLTDELFARPTYEYRGAPFWAWNCSLWADRIDRQVDYFKEMGLGGFHMHVRTGLATEYLSETYMKQMRMCVDKARRLGMKAYLYDEDRWPSGAAGGLVTKDPAYRARYLLFTPEKKAVLDASRREEMLAAYTVELDEKGCLASYSRIDPALAPEDAWYAYIASPAPDSWYNDQTYLNTLDKASVQRFIEVTHEAYKRNFKDDFGDTIPAIFTDEPQFTRKQQLKYATDRMEVKLPWTDDLPDSFRAAYGLELLDGVPELIWEQPDGHVSRLRYCYHDHVAERFAGAFADTVGGWCRKNGIALTGHMMEEPTLESQTCALGEAMRSYRGFDVPGIDMLCAWLEYTTAKQCQSAVHQYGCEGMMSELYGVTNWDFDFRGHKLHGDWQAALGVTLRVHHLSWMSMEGEAKRDYPASIFYQSPWWKEYRFVEDHFARVNTALTRGKPSVRVGVIHPVESYWLHWGPVEQTAAVREQLQSIFEHTTEWLLFGSVDFDFVSESLLPSQCAKGGCPLQVGQMAYDALIVPGCETLRSTTLERLEAFRAAGGKLIFIGDAPKYENALISGRGRKLWETSDHIPTERAALLEAIDDYRTIEIRDDRGRMTDNLVHQLRDDGDGKWLFIAHAKEPYNKQISTAQQVRIRIRGCYKPTLYNTQTGGKEEIAHVAADGRTEIQTVLYDYDSLLLWLEPCEGSEYKPAARQTNEPVTIILPERVRYSLDEPNVLLLDQAEFAVDDGPWHAKEEILRAYNVMRSIVGYRPRGGRIVQPWASVRAEAEHVAKLRFTIHAEEAFRNVQLAAEELFSMSVWLNGRKVPVKHEGWYVDYEICVMPLGDLQKGENVLEIHMPYAPQTNVEWMYLLGDFGVRVAGRSRTLIKLEETIGFGSITEQGMPYYGGNIEYHIPFDTEGGDVYLRIPHYLGTGLKVAVDDQVIGCIAYPPYAVRLGHLQPGECWLNLTLLGHRCNSFGPVHLADENEKWIGPGAWRTTGDKWTYEYRLKTEGILSAPVMEER